MTVLKLTSPRMRGAEVLNVQELLKKAGHDPGELDGVFGPATKAAVQAYQQANGLESDGIVGPKTMAVLGKSLDNLPVEPPVPPVEPPVPPVEPPVPPVEPPVPPVETPTADLSRFPIEAREEQPPPTVEGVDMVTTCELSPSGLLSGRTIIRNHMAFVGATVGVAVRLRDKAGNRIGTSGIESWGYDGTAFGVFGKASTRDSAWEMQVDPALALQAHSLEILQIPTPKIRFKAILAEIEDYTKTAAETYERIGSILGPVMR